jgi:hypothetical protein
VNRSTQEAQELGAGEQKLRIALLLRHWPPSLG